MGDKRKLEEEALRDLDRIFPGTKGAKKPKDRYEGSPLVLDINDDDPNARRR